VIRGSMAQRIIPMKNGGLRSSLPVRHRTSKGGADGLQDRSLREFSTAEVLAMWRAAR
jgi:hypothetical protein